MFVTIVATVLFISATYAALTASSNQMMITGFSNAIGWLVVLVGGSIMWAFQNKYHYGGPRAQKYISIAQSGTRVVWIFSIVFVVAALLNLILTSVGYGITDDDHDRDRDEIVLFIYVIVLQVITVIFLSALIWMGLLMDACYGKLRQQKTVSGPQIIT